MTNESVYPARVQSSSRSGHSQAVAGIYLSLSLPSLLPSLPRRNTRASLMRPLSRSASHAAKPLTVRHTPSLTALWQPCLWGRERVEDSFYDDNSCALDREAHNDSPVLCSLPRHTHSNPAESIAERNTIAPPPGVLHTLGLPLPILPPLSIHPSIHAARTLRLRWRRRLERAYGSAGPETRRRMEQAAE